MKNILIATPSGDSVYADFMVCLIAMIPHVMRAGINVALCNPRAPEAVTGRNLVLDDAAAMTRSGATPSHIMWIDADMTFPVDTVERLLAHDKDIVGASYPMRTPPHSATHKELDPPTTGALRKVRVIPGGMVLVRYPVYEKIGRYRNRDSMSHDCGFCHDAIEAGLDCWLDEALTREVSHIGLRHFRLK